MLAACLFLGGYIAVSAVSQRARTPRLYSFEALHAPLPEASPRPSSGNIGGLDLNAATRKELMALPGISASLADAIIAQREKQAFHFLEDLRMVRGIGDKRLETLREHGFVAGEE